MAEQVGRTFIVSDLHLRGPSDPNQKRFLDFIEARVAPCPDTTLVIAGDLVDFWFAVEAEVPEQYRQIVDRLAALPRVYWLEGNHDIGLTRALGGRRGGLRFVDGSLELSCGDWVLSVSHGDGVDPGDLSYRVLRAILRSPLARSLAQVLGAEHTLRVGQKITRRASSGPAANREPSRQWLGAARSKAVGSPVADSPALLVLGHGHHLGWWPEGLICLGDWLQFHSYLEVDPASAGPLLRQFHADALEDPVLADRPLGDARPAPGQVS